MFGNFIQFIVVLLIYATYQSGKETNFSLLESILLFLSLSILFAVQAWMTFRRLQRKTPQEASHLLDHRFNSVLLRQSILAIGLFTIDIYGLNLTVFLSEIPFFSRIPTLQALFCLAIFIGYLSIIWACAHRVYSEIYPVKLTRTAYITSNITFAIPVLLPWLILSGIADILYLLPFDFTRGILSTTLGQISYFFIFLTCTAIFGPTMIRKFWRCTPMEKNYLRLKIETLCEKAGMTYSDILYWPIFGGQMITAGIMGVIRKFRYILVTDALLRYLTPDELDAVIAHEIGHVKKHHLLFYLMFFSGFMLLSFAFQNVFVFSILYTKPIYRLLAGSGLSPITIKSALDGLVFILIFFLYFRFLFGFFMRNFERQADTYVFSLFESAQPLISTLKKIAVFSGQPPDRPNWHHYSIAERIGFIEKCETDRRWVSRHNRKIKTGIAIYLAGILCLSAVGYRFLYGKDGQTFFRNQLIQYIQEEISATPDNPLLLGVLGDLFYEAGDFKNTVATYEKSLSYLSKNPHVLNNLAWLYATCEDRQFRNPERALVLAIQAAQIEPTAQVLDTLAECYFINGEIDAAISTEKRALSAAKENQEYYRKQIEKFSK